MLPRGDSGSNVAARHDGYKGAQAKAAQAFGDSFQRQIG